MWTQARSQRGGRGGMAPTKRFPPHAAHLHIENLVPGLCIRDVHGPKIFGPARNFQATLRWRPGNWSFISARWNIYVHLTLMLRCQCPSGCPSVCDESALVHYSYRLPCPKKTHTRCLGAALVGPRLVVQTVCMRALGRSACWEEGRGHLNNNISRYSHC